MKRVGKPSPTGIYMESASTADFPALCSTVYQFGIEKFKDMVYLRAAKLIEDIFALAEFEVRPTIQPSKTFFIGSQTVVFRGIEKTEGLSKKSRIPL